MKKIYLILLATVVCMGQIMSQKDLYKAIKDIGEEAVYIQYITLTPYAGGTRIENTGARVTLEIVNNPFGIPWGAEAYYSSTVEGKPKEYASNHSFFYDGYWNTDHYTHPSFIRHSRSGRGYAMIDSVLFYFDNISKDGSSFKIRNIFIPEIEVAGGEAKTSKPKKGKKLSLKQRMEAVKMKMASKLGSPMWNKASKMNLEESVKAYFKKMKARQSAHTYSAKELKEIQGQKDALKKNAKNIKAYNDSIKATPEYQEMLARRSRANKGSSESSKKVTIKNNSSKSIDIMASAGPRISSIPGGSSRTFDCNRDLYLGYMDGTVNKKGSLIYGKNSGCGKTIEVN
jgi:uncharacterized protein YdaT